MKLLFLILLFPLFAHSQSVSIGSKSYTTSYNVIRGDTFIVLRPKGYADYPVKPVADGAYTFTIRAINNMAKGSFLYMYSPAQSVWTNSYMPLKTGYQLIPIKVQMNTGTTSVRIYSADSITIDNISYVKDAESAIDLAPVLSRITALEQKQAAIQRILDSLPPIYIQKDYGTEKNPIKP